MRLLSALLSTLLLSGCALNIEGNRYLEVTPKLDLFDFFTGNVKAWGMVQDLRGNVIARFTVNIDGSISDNTLTLDESFEYGLGDGVKKRVWTIEKRSETHYEGRADDIVNTAQGEVYGNALYWAYEMDLAVDSSTYRVKFDDWMWSFDEHTLMNRSYIRKFGVTFAEVTLFMQKQL